MKGTNYVRPPLIFLCFGAIESHRVHRQGGLGTWSSLVGIRSGGINSSSALELAGTHPCNCEGIAPRYCSFLKSNGKCVSARPNLNSLRSERYSSTGIMSSTIWSLEMSFVSLLPLSPSFFSSDWTSIDTALCFFVLCSTSFSVFASLISRFMQEFKVLCCLCKWAKGWSRL